MNVGLEPGGDETAQPTLSSFGTWSERAQERAHGARLAALPARSAGRYRPEGEFAILAAGLSNKEVIALLDGSAADSTVAGIAEAIATQFACELVLARVVPTYLPRLYLGPLPRRERAAFETVLRDRTERLLDQAHRELRELERTLEWRHVSHVVLTERSRTRAVCEFVAGRRVELVVVAAREQSNSRRPAGGDLAACMMRRSTAPVLKVACSTGPAAV